MESSPVIRGTRRGNDFVDQEAILHFETTEELFEFLAERTAGRCEEKIEAVRKTVGAAEEYMLAEG